MVIARPEGLWQSYYLSIVYKISPFRECVIILFFVISSETRNPYIPLHYVQGFGSPE